MRRFLALAVLFAAILLLLSSPAKSIARQLVIFKSHDYVSRNYEIQHFVDTLNLESGQLEVPLTLTVYNGSAEAPSFKWFRIMINGEIVASEQDMRGKEIASKDVSGIISGSNLQVQIEAGGVPGANLWWTLSTDQMAITGVEPQQVLPGQELKLIGENIPATPDLLTVTINGRPARVISATVNSVIVQVPESATPGTNDISLRSAKQVSNPIAVSVVSRPVPDILGIVDDIWMAPPGGTITINGRNFSPNTVEDKVMFGQVAAEVSSATFNQLVVVVPNWPYGPSQLNIPLTVTVNGMRSNSYPFDIGPMYHGATPSFGHD